MNPGDWKFHPWQLEPLFGDAWVERWLEVIRRVEEKEPDLKTLADLVVPSLWRKELRFLSYNAKIWGYDKDTRLELARFFKRVLDEVYSVDQFGLQSNLAKNYPAVQSFRNADWQKADRTSSRQIGRISSSCPALAWSLFTDFYYSNAYDMMGLYPAPSFGKNARLMVKQFGPFRCPDLWPQTKKYEYNQILVGAVYQGLTGRFDIINHFITKDSLADKLTHFSVLVDGKPTCEPQALDEIQRTMAGHAAAQFSKLNRLEGDALNRKAAHIKFHQFKEVFSALKMSWKPPQDVLDRMAGESYPNVRLPSSSSFATRVREWKQIVDPRIEFNPTRQRYWKKWIQKRQGAKRYSKP